MTLLERAALDQNVSVVLGAMWCSSVTALLACGVAAPRSTPAAFPRGQSPGLATCEARPVFDHFYSPYFDESLRGLAHISGFEPRINNIVHQSECHIRPEKEWSPNPKDRHQAPIDERVRNAVSVYSCYSRTGWRPRGASLASPLWLVGANHTRLTSMASGAASLRRRLALCAACAACAALGAALALLRGAAVAPSRRPGATDRAAATLDGSAALAALAMRPAWHPPPGAARPKQAKCVAAAQASEQSRGPTLQRFSAPRGGGTTEPITVTDRHWHRPETQILRRAPRCAVRSRNLLVAADRSTRAPCRHHARCTP